jgi:hypothetical protein
MWLERTENDEHSYQQEDGRNPVKPAEAPLFPLTDVLTVDVPIGQTHQYQEKEAEF